MARVNVETRALAESRLFRFMKIMGWRRAMALGTLLLLWHDSQEMLKVMATKEDILHWIGAESDEEALKIFDALVECRYLSKYRTLYRIHGNERQVSFLKQKSFAGKIGGVRSGIARGVKQVVKASFVDETCKSNEINEAEHRNAPKNDGNSGTSKQAFKSVEANARIGKEMQGSGDAEKPASPPKPATRPTIPPDLQTLWNRNAKGLPKMHGIAEKREKVWMDRWCERPDDGYWEEVIHRMSKSEFLKGKNDRGWSANVDWLLKPDSHIKVSEGLYDNKGGSGIENLKWED